MTAPLRALRHHGRDRLAWGAAPARSWHFHYLREQQIKVGTGDALARGDAVGDLLQGEVRGMVKLAGEVAAH